MVTSAVSVLLAAAVACWPDPAAPRRLSGLLGRPRPGRRWSVRRPGPRALTAAFAALLLGSAVLAGVGGVLAAALVVGSTARRWRLGSRRRAVAREQAALVDAVGMLVAELRSGAHPAMAAAAVASTGHDAAHRVLGAVAAGARLGAPLPTLLARRAADEPSIAEGLTRLASAWELADQHGVALAELVEAVRADLDTRHRMGGELRALLAGPRATAWVLAALPVLGVLLGEGVGAGPVRVLTDTGPGQGLLVVGCVLACAGMAWSDRIMARAVRA